MSDSSSSSDSSASPPPPKAQSSGSRVSPIIAGPPKLATDAAALKRTFDDEESRLRKKLLQKKLAAESKEPMQVKIFRDEQQSEVVVTAPPPAKTSKREVVMVVDEVVTEEGLDIRPPQAAPKLDVARSLPTRRVEPSMGGGGGRDYGRSNSGSSKHDRHRAKHPEPRSRHDRASSSSSKRSPPPPLASFDARQRLEQSERRAAEGWARWKKQLDPAPPIGKPGDAPLPPPPATIRNDLARGGAGSPPRQYQRHGASSPGKDSGRDRSRGHVSSKQTGRRTSPTPSGSKSSSRHDKPHKRSRRDSHGKREKRSGKSDRRSGSKQRGVEKEGGREVKPGRQSRDDGDNDKAPAAAASSPPAATAAADGAAESTVTLKTASSQPILDHGASPILSEHDESNSPESDPGPDGGKSKAAGRKPHHVGLQDIDSPPYYGATAGDRESGEATDSDEEPTRQRKAARAQHEEQRRQQQQQQQQQTAAATAASNKYSKFASSSESDRSDSDDDDDDRRMRRSPSQGDNSSDATPEPADGRRGEAAEAAAGHEPDQVEAEDLFAHLPVYYPGVSGCRSVDEFHCLNRIEEGTYGVVYRAKEKRTDEVVALKRLKMEKEKEGFPITSLREINMLLKAGKHPNVVNVREIVVGSNMDRIYLVMDYVEHDMKSLMESMKQPFLVGEVKTLLQQLLSGVHHLHDNWILHRDLKTSNLLLSHRGILKIGDFGLAREYGTPLKPYTPIVVTLWYRAPELLLGCKQYSTPIDLWSVGCIFSEFLTLKPLFPGRGEIDQINRHFKMLGTPNADIWPDYPEMPAIKKMTFTAQPYNHLRKQFGTSLSDEGFKLLNKLLTYNPARRITALQALRHGWFAEDPRPVHPDMFPTWPAKSEQGKPPPKNAEPKPPSGGKQYDEEEASGVDNSILESLNIKRSDVAGSSGFALRFDAPKF